MSDLIRVYEKNSDSASIQRKSVIDISFSQTDATASLLSSSMKTNYDGTNQIVVLPRDAENLQPGYVYYTPLYVEKINYDVWKTRINKTFEELV